MKYPKQMMRISEMVKHTGLSEEYFLSLYRNPNLTFISKLNPMNANSPIMIETEAYEKWRMKQIEIEKNSMRMRMRA